MIKGGGLGDGGIIGGICHTHKTTPL